jgi:peroxiredoxin
MALTETIPIPLGFKAPDFRLTNGVDDLVHSPLSLKGSKGLLVMFICNHCPYVVHVRGQLIDLANHYQSLGVGFVAISSNDPVRYPDDAPARMKELAMSCGFPFPYLFDESQTVARAYHAACTPDFALFDAALDCVYRGRLDASTPGNGVPVTGTDLRTALDRLLDGVPQQAHQVPSMGCSIKWRES